MSPLYGFEMYSGQVRQVEAASIHEAMQIAEADSGSIVSRGRLLDGFDNDAPAGRGKSVRPW